MIHRPISCRCVVLARVVRSTVARALPASAGIRFRVFGIGAAMMLLGACGEEPRPDGSFVVVESRSSRVDRPEPARLDTPRSPAGSGATPRAQASAAGQAAGLTWKIPPSFEARPMPASLGNVYLDYCVAAKSGAETHDGYLVSSQSSGTVAANLARWKGQFPDGRVVRESAIEVAAAPRPLTGALLEMEGPTYAMRGSLWAEGPPVPIRALFAAIEGPEGLVTFRYLGTPASAERMAPAFDALVQSVRRQSPAQGGGGE